jgi:hypothetical protein
MATSKRKSPGTATNSAEALQRKMQAEYTRFMIREAAANITIALMVSVVMWSCVLGMSGNFQPGNDVALGPVAEVDHDGR